MAQLPKEVVKAYIASELPGAQAWADRRGLDLRYDEEQLSLRVFLEGAEQEGKRQRYLLDGHLDDYRALPPVWRFLHPGTGEEAGMAAFPAPPGNPVGGASIFLRHGERGAVICARFNRWAYGEHSGPHPDWGAMAGWETVVTGQVAAITLGDMLQRIELEVSASMARMEELP